MVTDTAMSSSVEDEVMQIRCVWLGSSYHGEFDAAERPGGDDRPAQLEAEGAQGPLPEQPSSVLV